MDSNGIATGIPSVLSQWVHPTHMHKHLEILYRPSEPSRPSMVWRVSHYIHSDTRIVICSQIHICLISFLLMLLLQCTSIWIKPIPQLFRSRPMRTSTHVSRWCHKLLSDVTKSNGMFYISSFNQSNLSTVQGWTNELHTHYDHIFELSCPLGYNHKYLIISVSHKKLYYITILYIHKTYNSYKVTLVMVLEQIRNEEDLFYSFLKIALWNSLFWALSFHSYGRSQCLHFSTASKLSSMRKASWPRKACCAFLVSL